MFIQVFPPDEIEQVSNKDDMKTSLKKVVKEVGAGIGEGEARGEGRDRSLKRLRVGSSCLHGRGDVEGQCGYRREPQKACSCLGAWPRPSSTPGGWELEVGKSGATEGD